MSSPEAGRDNGAMKRRVWRTKKAGRIDRLTMIDEKLADLEPGLVRVKVGAVGLNFADIFALTGLYSATPEGPFIPGLEFSGEVMQAPQSSPLSAGQRVMGCIRFGAYAEAVDVPASQLRPVPESWNYEQGAAFPVQTLTAWYALTSLGALKAGQTVLIHSAAGGVGLQAMAICSALQANPIGTVSTRDKKEFLEALGYDRVIVRDRHFPSGLDEALDGQPLHLVLDAIGGRIQRQSFEALAPTGRLVVFGAADFAPGKSRPRYLSSVWKYLTRPRYDPLGMVSENRSVLAFNLIWLWQDTELFDQMMDAILALDIPAPHVGKSFSFDNAPGAIEHLRSGRSIGKVVLSL